VNWRWFDATYEALARGQVDLAKGGDAALCGRALTDGDHDAQVLASPGPIALPEARVVRVGRDTGWVFGDLQWGPEVSAEGIRSVIARVGGRAVAYLPLDKPYGVDNGVFTVVVDPEAVLMLGNRRS
jgi:hypothetical protein